MNLIVFSCIKDTQFIYNKMARESKSTSSTVKPVSESDSGEVQHRKRKSKTPSTSAPVVDTEGQPDTRDRRVESVLMIEKDFSSSKFVEVNLNDHESVSQALKSLSYLTRYVATRSAKLTDALSTLFTRAQRDANRKRHKRPVDLSKPARLSSFEVMMEVKPELLKFLGLPKGSYVSRSTVNSAVSKYINDHKLKDQATGVIKPDATLKTILSKTATNKKNEAITVLNHKTLQNFLTSNYLNKAPEDQQPDADQVRLEKLQRAAGAASSAATTTTATTDDAESSEEAPRKSSKKSKQ